MGVLRAYWRAHPWQHRAVTLTLAAIAGVGTAILLQPAAREFLILRGLGSLSSARRASAIRQAAEVARTSPRMARKLNALLESDDDRLFAAAAMALNRIGQFQTPSRDPAVVDRMRMLDLAAAQAAADRQPTSSRAFLLVEMILSGRDNPYLRQAAGLAAGDPDSALREMAAVLAARLGEDGVLRSLLKDPEPGVAAAAALDAGLAGRRRLLPSLQTLFETSGDAQAISSAAYALALLDPRGSSPNLCDRLRKEKSERLRDRLLWVMTVLDDAGARAAVAEALGPAGGDRRPPAMALLAAARLRLPPASAHAKEILRDLREHRDVTAAQFLSALEAAEATGLDSRETIEALCRDLWNPQADRILAPAVRLLGLQALHAGPNSTLRERVIRTLREAAVYERTGVPADSSPAARITPMASAAAAAALWRMEPSPSESSTESRPAGISILHVDAESSAFYVRFAAAAPAPAAGDALAWEIARSGRAEAYALGLSLLPDLDAPPELQEYNDEVRAAGAMLLALSARTDPQKQAAARRIEGRLQKAKVTRELASPAFWAYECALALLGRSDSRRVADLLQQGQAPPRRAVTALCLAGNPAGLDWLLWNIRQDPERSLSLLLDEGLGDVLREVAPSLPTVERAAETDVQLWQLWILQDSYALRRQEVLKGSPR